MLDSGGNIFVSDSGNNRVVIFPSLLTLPNTGATAYLAIGQPTIQTAVPNWNSPDGLATPEGLFGPAGILVDRRDTLYVGDTGNNRVVHFLKAVAIVNAATSQPTVPIGLGAWCTLYGVGLSADTKQSNSVALPTSLAGRELVVNDQMKAPLHYVSPGQINFVFPKAASTAKNGSAQRTSSPKYSKACGSALQIGKPSGRSRTAFRNTVI